MALELPMSVKISPSSIICDVCKLSRCFKKYKHHLLLHVRNGEISFVEVQKILFKCRIPRSDARNGISTNPQFGYVCRYRNDLNMECRHVVLDLPRHLAFLHKLDRSCSLFADLIAESKKELPLERHADSKMAEKSDKQSSLHELREPISSQNLAKSVLSFNSGGIYGNNCIPSADHYSFTVESDIESSSEVELVTNNGNHDSSFVSPLPQLVIGSDTLGIRFIDPEKIICEFHAFLLTKRGGDRRNTPVKGDLSSFRCMIKEIGWDNLWDPNKLNQYVSCAKSSPSTIYCRLRSYEKFIHFLRVQFPSFLPSLERLRGIESMLSHLKEAMGKDRHMRSKDTMAASRVRMPISFNYLRKWRARREDVDVKRLFSLFTDETNCLDESLYLQIRNYLIVEILLANAQRSGIIEGMRVKEVLLAKDNRNTDSLHHIYVEHHKTGYIQAAIIYLGAEIYSYLKIFVCRVIPLLPSITIHCGTRGEDDCHVFQTWKCPVLRTSTVSHCLRSGLRLFGIEDPHGCPTDYRKAASTLISMNNPSMQESLSQFMCHARSTTERHYRHHMSHRGLYPVFNELARCQALPAEGEISVAVSPKLASTSDPSFSNNTTYSIHDTIPILSIEWI